MKMDRVLIRVSVARRCGSAAVQQHRRASHIVSPSSGQDPIHDRS
jgi:hypothetical protein